MNKAQLQSYKRHGKVDKRYIPSYYWPSISTVEYQPDRVPDYYRIDHIVEDRHEWYFNVAGQYHDTLGEAITELVRLIDYYSQQNACVSWSINPIYFD